MRVFLASAVAVLVFAAPAFADPAADPNEHCVAAILSQNARELSAGGGPKAPSIDTNSPINCDHFWQRTGEIGNGIR